MFSGRAQVNYSQILKNSNIFPKVFYLRKFLMLDFQSVNVNFYKILFNIAKVYQHRSLGLQIVIKTIWIHCMDPIFMVFIRKRLSTNFVLFPTTSEKHISLLNWSRLRIYIIYILYNPQFILALCVCIYNNRLIWLCLIPTCSIWSLRKGIIYLHEKLLFIYMFFLVDPSTYRTQTYMSIAIYLLYQWQELSFKKHKET